MRIPNNVKHLLKSKEGEVLRLELGDPENYQPGFISIGEKNADIIHNIEEYPYPIPDNSVMLIKLVHVVEQINPLNKGFIRFMDEMWRMLKYDGQLLISTFYAGSAGYWGDPCNVNGCTNNTWYYFDPLNPLGFYKKYKPKPWKVANSYSNPDGLMEVLLLKMRCDISYLK